MLLPSHVFLMRGARRAQRVITGVCGCHESSRKPVNAVAAVWSAHFSIKDTRMSYASVIIVICDVFVVVVMCVQVCVCLWSGV